MATTHITDESFEKEVLQSQGLTLVDFWAPWCGPCRMLGPIIDEISEEKSDLKVCKVNVDEEIQTAQKYGVMSIPTMILFKNGEVVDTLIGLQPKEAILAAVNRNI